MNRRRWIQLLGVSGLSVITLLLSLQMVQQVCAQGISCPPGFVWQRMSGVGCVQENCFGIANARYGYTGQCICNEGYRACSEPVDYAGFDKTLCGPFCPGGKLVACVAPDAKCPGEKPAPAVPPPIAPAATQPAAPPPIAPVATQPPVPPPPLESTPPTSISDLVRDLEEFLVGEGVQGPSPGQVAASGVAISTLIGIWVLVNLLSGARLEDLLRAVKTWRRGEGDEARAEAPVTTADQTPEKTEPQRKAERVPSQKDHTDQAQPPTLPERESHTGDRLAPVFKPPRDYGPGKTNPYDPSIEKQKEMWEKARVIWDPDQLVFRPPKPGEIPLPPGEPEIATPFTARFPREKVPIECLDLYDAYVQQQGRALTLPSEIQDASKKQWDAQTRLNAVLAKFTLKLGFDVGDIVTSVDGVARLAVALGDAMTQVLPRALSQALTKSRSLHRKAASKVAGLVDEVAEAGRALLTKRKAAETLSETANALKGKADDAKRLLTEAEEALTHSRKAVSEAEEQLSNISRRLDDLKGNRGALELRKAKLEELKALQEQHAQIYAEYLARKPGVLGSSPCNREVHELELLDLDIDGKNELLSKLRATVNPSQATLQEIARLQGEVEELTRRGRAIKQVVDEALCQFFGVSSTDEITDALQDRHLDEYVRRAMGEEKLATLDSLRSNPEVAYDPSQDIGRQIRGIDDQLDGVKRELKELWDQAGKNKSTLHNLSAQANADQAKVTQFSSAAVTSALAADEAKRKALAGDIEAQDAQQWEKQAQAQLDAAKQEEQAAQQELEAVQNQANQHLKRQFAETPDEVAKVIMDARNRLQQAVEELQAKQKEYDQVRDELRFLKEHFDKCMERYAARTGSQSP